MSHYSRLCCVRDYLAARFNERTSLAEAASQAGLSPFYFHRLFASAFNETPHEFVTRLRIDQSPSIINLIFGTTTTAGLEVKTPLPSRTQVLDQQMAQLQLPERQVPW